MSHKIRKMRRAPKTMPEDIHELHEHAREGHQHPSLAPVSLTMAILAVLVAAVSLLGHRAHTEEVLLQTQASDRWAYFQAKNIRRHTYELFSDLLSISDFKNAERAAKLQERYKSELDRYREEQKEIEAEGKHLEQERDMEKRKADRFDLGEVFLEISLVVTSITLLTGRRRFWVLGIAFGLMGVAVASTACLVR